MPPKKNMMPMQKPEQVFGTFKRIFSYMYGFKVQFFLVIAGIIFSAFAGVAGNALLTPLVNNVEDAVNTGTWDKGKFIGILALMGCVYLVGALSSLLFQRMMMKISTTTLMRIRNDLFNKMESLPVKFFDKRTHGELMSLYTNDTDTLREMLSNSIANVISSAITIVGVFAFMIAYSWILTIIVIVMLFIIVGVIGAIGSRSGAGFIVALTGDIMTMPGLPKVPAAERIDVDENGRITLSHKELLGTWEQNAENLKVGETVPGIVRSVEKYGISVELTPNLAGLAEYSEGIEAGSHASVYIKSIIPSKMKIKLIIVDSFEADYPTEPLKYFIDGGHIEKWVYSPEGSEKIIESQFDLPVSQFA